MIHMLVAVRLPYTIPLLRTSVCLLWIIAAAFQKLTAQPELSFSTEKTKKGEAIFANNAAYCPISMSIAIDMDNTTFEYNKEPFFVIPARTEHVKLGEIVIYDKTQKWRYSTKINSCYGDLRIVAYDSLYAYTLPFPKDSAYELIQGYDGSFSHHQQHALDFAMPEGTPVVAARDGIVMTVVQHFTTACLDDSCKQRANLISIYYPDGTMASYVHLRYNGAAVKPGDIVKKGDVLGYSGNTGYSSVAHLHFDCYLPNPGQKRTIPTQFFVAGSDTAHYLEQGRKYRRSL